MRTSRITLATLGVALLASLTTSAADAPPAKPLPVSAHNCYLADRDDNPRLAEALALGIDNIEIDLGWDEKAKRLIVGHDAAPRAGVKYPEFESMFIPGFQRHAKDHPPGTAPTVLSVDWKTDRPEAVAAFKAFLDDHAEWFSSAGKPASGNAGTPLTVRRLTVCFTGSEAAKDAYDALVPPGGTYRAFRDRVTGMGATFAPDVATYLPADATAYHRFLTFHWGVVERGGPFAAGDWTAADADRLRALVDVAHRRGFRVRLYCLNGYTGTALGGYRFRSDDAAKVRWLAAAKAGVDWIASDEYREVVDTLRNGSAAGKESASPTRAPLRSVVDLDVGETARVNLRDGTSAEVTLDGVDVTVDPVRSALREARVRLTINGKPAMIGSGNYRLPEPAGGVQVDCPVVSAYNRNSTEDHWGLVKAARVRLWPAGSPWIEPETFAYPARQRWFASMTQMANEPVYVDGGEVPSNPKIYYHSGLDIGGAEGLVEVVAATDGVVASSGLETLPGLDVKGDGSPVRPRYDVIYLRDDRGWYYRYSHLKSIDPAVTPGSLVTKGQKLGALGKEGGSGGWSHLHFEAKSLQPSGKWGTEEAFAYLWQAATREQNLEVIAVARPHTLARIGEPVRLDGSKSWSRSGPPARHDWIFSDGTTSTSPVVERVFDTPGMFSETLKVTAENGQFSYDFAVVQVIDPKRPDVLPPTIHASYHPTTGLKAGDPVTFKVRTFRVGRDGGHESWDFGDGTPAVAVQSDGNARQLDPDGYAVHSHRFEKPGDYLVRVERAARNGLKATARLHVRVE
jgi:murein DD-endopeptidase MepM/ murein hydrolase activator NlpD